MKNEKEKSVDEPAPEVIQHLKDQIEKGVITVITVDTTAFDDSGMRLDKGLFLQLRQFGRHPSDFIISEVVLSEIERHLTKHLKSAKDRFSRDMIDACEFVGGDATEVARLKEKFEMMPAATDLCDEQIESFLELSAATVVEVDDTVEVSKLLSLYFEGKPPFHGDNPKKNEFPDAIALLSLECWAEANEKEVLVVSRDADWESFCKGSKRLHLVKNLATGLALFQTPAEIVQGMLKKVHASLQDKSSPIFEQLLKNVQNYDWHGHVSVDAYSQFEYDEEIYTEIADCVFEAGLEGIKLTEANDQDISVTFNLNVIGHLKIHYSFRKWDGIDKEYLPMGSGTSTVDFSLPVAVILNMPVKAGDLSIEDLEIEPDPLHIELGDINPDWMSGRN